MATYNQNQLYANLMTEVKARIDAVNHTIQGRAFLPHPFVREFCWLQLRMLCELVALSCLVAHGDVTYLKPHKVGKTYSADDILRRLSELRPHFFPFATRQGPRTLVDGKTHMDMFQVMPSPLTKEELLKLYAVSHRHLHRGNLKSLLKKDASETLDRQINAPEILQWAQKLNDLLSHHTIAISEKVVIICMLRDSTNNNQVQVATALAQ